MKKFIYILLFIPLFSFGQFREYTNSITGRKERLEYKGGNVLIDETGREVIYDYYNLYNVSGVDSLELGLQLYYTYTYLSNDSAEFEATDDTVIYVDRNLIVLDTTTASIIELGTLVKFGNTEFTIIDTLGSRDSIMLNSNYYESIGDTMYVGVLSTWHDESGNENNGISPIGQRPRIIWGDSDTSHIRFDGINDIVNFTNINLGKQYSIVLWEKYFSHIKVVISDGGSSDWILIYINTWRHRVNSGTVVQLYMTNDFNKLYNTVIVRDTINIDLYSNNSFEDDVILGNNDDWIINNIGGYTDTYYDGNIYEIRLYNRVLTENNINDLYNQTLDRFVRDTGYIGTYIIVENSGSKANVGLDYDLHRDYILCGEYNHKISSRILIKTRFNVNVDTIDFSDYIDLLQGITYDQDTMYYAWGTMNDSTVTTDHVVLIGISSNGNKILEEQTPSRLGYAQCGLQCSGDTAIWLKPADNYIRLFKLNPFEQIDSIYTPIPSEGLWFDSDSTYWTGTSGAAFQYRISDGSIRKTILNPTVNWEGVIIDKRGWLWFNSDEWYHEGYGDNGVWIYDPEFYDVEYP